ncbi:uncharacterized protein RJT20DRAFT_127223 [Scheffersomyces xylosifermentans]|uniref:uncharacterized protein n=1 Tax=Scheffersomyces xylosifermentans TaxID=1304137 RepID=UPI00315CCF41
MSSLRKSTRVRTLTPKVRACLSDTTNKKQLATSAPIAKRTASEAHDDSNNLKKRRVVVEEVNSDKIDPVEKLLSLTNLNNDILNELVNDNSLNISNTNQQDASDNIDEDVDEDEYEDDDIDEDDEDNDQPSSKKNQLTSLNFTKILQDNIRSYYSKFRKSPIEIYNDNSSFALLNKNEANNNSIYNNSNASTIASASNSTPQSPQTPSTSEVPFFRNVNFSGSSRSDYTFDDYFSYDELTDDSSSDEALSPTDKPAPPKKEETKASSLYFPKLSNKMSFHYRQNHSNLNLSLNNDGFESGAVSPLSPASTVDLPSLMYDSTNGLSSNGSSVSIDVNGNHELFKYLNKRSILSGKASEMVGTGNLLINDFFL